MFEDDELVAVDKPAGIASQGGEGLRGQNLVDLARAHFNAPHIAVLHRIDRNVSGVVLIAKTTRMARAMSELVAAGSIERRYEAVVKGHATEPRLISHWLRKDTRDNHVQLLDAPSDADPTSAPRDHKHTLTRMEPVVQLSTLLGVCTIVNAWPITGRSHQIRAQLSAVGLPIVGDPKYGVLAIGVQRPLLHATSVRFDHPLTGKPLLIQAPVPWTRAELTQLKRKPKR